MFEITLSLPPSINASYSIINGRRCLSKVARAWRNKESEYITLIARTQYDAKKEPLFKEDVKVVAIVLFVFPNNIRRDQSNYIKQLYDCFVDSGHVIVDDSQIIEEHIYSRVEKGKKEVTVKIERIN